MSFPNQNNNMNQNWNNMFIPNNMNMNNFMINNMGMNNLNNPMAVQMNMMLMQFYNQMQQMQQLNNQMQMNMFKYANVNNNAQATDRLPQYDQTTDPFLNYPGPRVNLMFQTAKGHKIIIAAPYNLPFHQVLVEYIRKCGLGPNALYDGFYFLFNGAKIPINDNKKLVQDIAKTWSMDQGVISIVVVDTKNLIGS